MEDSGREDVVNCDAETTDLERDRRWLYHQRLESGEMETGEALTPEEVGSEDAAAAAEETRKAEEEAGAALIVANLPRSALETGAEARAELEGLLRAETEAGPGAERVEWFPSFRRVRAHFRRAAAAAATKGRLDQLLFHGHSIRVYLTSVPRAGDPATAFLAPPPLEKQFLISPPASPPVGWEQTVDAAPVINVELVARLAALSASRDPAAEAAAAGLRTELHPATAQTPSILLDTAPLPDLHLPNDSDKENFPRPPKLPRTPRPPN